MCKCTPNKRTPFCGAPGCEWPPQDKARPTIAELEALLGSPDSPQVEITPAGEVVMKGLRAEIQCAINRVSAENGSNTPDFILADFLVSCLAAFDRATQQRERWYDVDIRPGRSPDGYAYRYKDSVGTVIRFNGGMSVNGHIPIESIPYWLGLPHETPQPASKTDLSWLESMAQYASRTRDRKAAQKLLDQLRAVPLVQVAMNPAFGSNG